MECAYNVQSFAELSAAVITVMVYKNDQANRTAHGTYTGYKSRQ